MLHWLTSKAGAERLRAEGGVLIRAWRVRSGRWVAVEAVEMMCRSSFMNLGEDLV